MFGRSVVILFALSFASVALAKSRSFSSLAKKQSLIHYEPPFENNFERTEQITEHYITQLLDNFDHQNKQTFEMVNCLLLLFFCNC